MIIRKENVMGIPRFESLDDKFSKFVDIIDNLYLYVLIINDDNLYIGCTNDFNKRYKDHVKRRGPNRTKYYKTINILHCFEIHNKTRHCLEIYENLLTKILCENNKWNRVNGGIFTNSLATKEYIINCKGFYVNHFYYSFDQLKEVSNDLKNMLENDIQD